MKALLQNALLALGSVIVALLGMEIFLRFMPVAWAPPVHAPTSADPIQRYAANKRFTWSLGWNFYKVVHDRTNAQGFVADYDYVQNASPLVAVVGDSFIEAMQVPYAASVTGLLHTMLGEHGRAYAFAQSGAALSQYVAYARLACQTYHPQKLVVSVVGNDFDESLYIHRKRDGLFNLRGQSRAAFEWRLTDVKPAGLAEIVARNSALALYLVRNVGVAHLLAGIPIGEARAAPEQWVGNTSADTSASRLQQGFDVIDWFLATLPKQACLAPDDIVLAVDAPRPEVYGDAAMMAARSSYFGLMRRDLIVKARRLGFRVIDLEEVFRDVYRCDGQRFENPTDFHWNEAGHAAVAAKLRQVMSDWLPLARHHGSRQQNSGWRTAWF